VAAIFLRPELALALTGRLLRPGALDEGRRSGPFPSGSPDDILPIIARTLRITAADVELEKLERLGGLARAVFDRIASADGDVRGLFSEEAAAEYSAASGNDVRVDAVQPAVQALLAANLAMRLGHGRYGISDPFVQRTWLERKVSGLLNGPDAAWAPTRRSLSHRPLQAGGSGPAGTGGTAGTGGQAVLAGRARPPLRRTSQSLIASRSTARAALTFVAR